MIGGLKWFVVILFILIFGYFIFHFILPRLWVFGSITGYTIGPITQKPQFSIYDVTLKGIGLKGIDLDVTLDVYNPNNIPITLDRATFNIYINDVKIGTVNLPQTISIPANSHEYPRIALTVSYEGGLVGGWGYVKEKLFGGRVQLRIEGNAYVNVPILGEVTIPFSYSKEIE
jgi:LEA14-like dessication related protein